MLGLGALAGRVPGVGLYVDGTFVDGTYVDEKYVGLYVGTYVDETTYVDGAGAMGLCSGDVRR